MCFNLTNRISFTILLSFKTVRNSLWNASYSVCTTATVDVKIKIFISVLDIVFWLKIRISPALHSDVYINWSWEKHLFISRVALANSEIKSKQAPLVI